MSPLYIFLFIAGLGRLVAINAIGQLYLTDLMLTASFLFLMTVPRSRAYILTGSGLLFVACGSLYLLNAIITDVYRDTPFEDWSRGWSKILFFFSDMFGLVVLTELKISRLSAFLSGLIFSWLIAPTFVPNESILGVGDAWKFAYSPALTTLAAMLGLSVLARRLFGRIVEWLPLTLLGVVNLAFNDRSVFGVAMAAVAFGILKLAVDSRPRLQRAITPAFFLLLIGGGLVFSQGMIAVYGTAAGNGWLGLEAQDKYLRQSSGDVSLLQAGRVESLVSIQAIEDAPFIGHGSWAQDFAYVSLLVDILASKGIEPEGDPYASSLIPTHSHLLGAWVEVGIIGGVFWLTVIGIMFKALYVTLKRPDVPATFVAFILFTGVWDVLFSPFGAEQRFQMASKICIAMSVLVRPHGASGLIQREQAELPVPNRLPNGGSRI